MDLGRYPLDLMLVPFGICLTTGYHAYIWHRSRTRQQETTIGDGITRRRSWLKTILKENNEKKGMLAVQSSRNSLMSAILSATIAITINSSLAALANNTYNSSHLFRPAIYGSQAGAMLVLKYASASILSLCSFLCSSIAVASVIEGNFLVNSCEELFHPHTQLLLKRGYVMAFVGNRVLYITLCVLLWLVGPVPMALSSLALVWVLYNLDFSTPTLSNKYWLCPV